METKDYTINAAGKTIGEVATEAARALMGKDQPTYEPQAFPTTKVTIDNAAQLRITERKAALSTFKRYSGYPGGLKEMTLAEMIEKKGASEALRLAIDGMIPRNRLRAKRMKLLTVNE